MSLKTPVLMVADQEAAKGGIYSAVVYIQQEFVNHLLSTRYSAWCWECQDKYESVSDIRAVK